MIKPEALLLLPRIRVQNVNTISSPLTWGFPSPTMFAGYVHALHRQVSGEMNLTLNGVAVVCHRFEPQASKPSGKRTSVFHLTRNPVGSDGKTAAIVEEGRAHIEVSLLIGVFGPGLYEGVPADDLAARIYENAVSMRCAGGSILPPTRLNRWQLPSLEMWPGTSERERQLSKRLARRLLPGFALVSREALLDRRWQELQKSNPQATALDALLDLSSLNFDPSSSSTLIPEGAADNATVPAEWRVRRKDGWLVPIPAGYHGISELYEPGQVKNARDRSTPFRFVEGIYTIGEWLSPHRVEDIRRLLWVHDADPETGLYRCTTPYFAGLLSIEGV